MSSSHSDPASTLSRLEKLADANYGPIPKEEFFGGDFSQHEAFMAGGKALLQILSEPGGACGPRVKIHPEDEQTNVMWARLSGFFRNDEKEKEGYQEYVPLTELLQARAAQAKAEAEAEFSHNGYCGSAKIADELQAQLASSEARVRILTIALEYYASEKHFTEVNNEDGYSLSCENGEVARQALLEVQR